MKVKELISILSKYPEESEVLYEGPDLSLNDITSVIEAVECNEKDSKEPTSIALIV